MKKETNFDVIVCGGGAAGIMLCQALTKEPFFDQCSILLIEADNKNQNDRTWCFWEEGEGQWDDLIDRQWERAQFLSKGFKTDFSLSPYRYKKLRGIDVYTSLYAQLEKADNLTLLRSTVTALNPEGDFCKVQTTNGLYRSKRVFSSIPHQRFTQQKKYPVLQQHFVGWEVETENPIFDPKTVVFMDFDLPQKNNTRFMYVLPYTPQKALVEYTLFSADLLPTAEYEQAITDYLLQKKAGKFKIVEKEQGSIPMTAYDFAQHNRPHLLHIGTAGGWTKASTGFTFKKTERKVAELVAFLKKEQSLNRFERKSKFHFYDLLFLDVLAKYNGDGNRLFTLMFRRNHPKRIFAFLDEQTSILQEVLIMLSFPVGRFVWALLRRIL